MMLSSDGAGCRQSGGSRAAAGVSRPAYITRGPSAAVYRHHPATEVHLAS